jgi:beta-glucuronidase
VGWYRVRFAAPRATPGFGWQLRFEQVRRTARVWLNGREVGRHADPYVPFTLPATGLRGGAPNELVVRVDNRKAKEPREGWWNWGGIVRPVSLVPRGRLVLKDPGFMSRVDCAPGGSACTARVLVGGMLENRGPSPVATPRLRLRLESPGGGGPIEKTAPARALMPGEATRVSFTVPVPDPRLWAPGTPNRYAATLTTLDGDAPTQVDSRRVGLRQVRVRNGLLELNGRQLDLRGAAIQEDLPGRGPALGDADVARIVRELKAVHANVTRAHYLLNPKLLDAFDAAGIMVWSQAPIYHRDRLLETPPQREQALSTLRRTVLAARSHPSVITHSVANELSAVPDRVPGTRRFLHAALAETRRLDPTLPVSVDLLSYPGFPAAKAYAQYDLLGINSYFGWYPGKKRHSTADLADLGPFLDRMRRQYPTQGMVLTEFGAESTFEGPALRKESYAFQADYVRRVLDVVRRRPFVGGAIYWTLREFQVKPDWDGGAKRAVPRDGIHNKGLITYDGRRKPAWAVAEQAFASTPAFRSVPAATGLALPDGRGGGGGDALLVFAVALVAGLLVLDVWALAGILRGGREEPMTEARY